MASYRGAPFSTSYAELERRANGRTGSAGRKLCLWCLDEIGIRRRVWCGDACSEAFYAATTWSGLRSAVARRDRGVCALCRIDCRASRRTYAALAPRARAALAVEHEIPKRRLRKTWWDADHIVPIAEGGANVLENLRTLCLRCHKCETKALGLRRLAAPRRAEADHRRLLDRARRSLDRFDALGAQGASRQA